MYAFVDTETTGFARNGVQPRIVSIAWMVADDPSQARIFKYSIVKPDGFSIPPAAASVHGISTARAQAEGRPLAAVLEDFAKDLRSLEPMTIVAHNAAYDMPIIAAEFQRIRRGDPCQGRSTHCTMLAARKRWPGESAKLGDVYERLFRSAMQGAHHAGADVRACAQIFFALQSVQVRAAPPPPNARDQDVDDPDTLVEAVLEWAATKPGFDTSFVESLQERLALGRELSGSQMVALRNIITKWKIRI
jgi:DNA polymerase III epsilon subunit-like protein